MYKEFFKLDRYPFHNTPDPAFFYASRGHREALASMVYGIQEGKGFTLVTGDVGTGKTMLVQALKNELGDAHLLIEIGNPWITPEEVFETVRVRIKAGPAEGDALFEALKKRLALLAKKGQRVVLIIDEAHQLPERTLEGIRLLSNIETPTEKLLQIVLLGQDELAEILGRYSMRQVQQRIAMSFHLQRLNAQETGEYIQHRLRVAGGYAGLFQPECVESIFREAGGSPRVINQLCDNALLFAFGRRSSTVTADIVGDAIANFNPAKRGSEPLPAPAVAAPATPAGKPVTDGAREPARAEATAEKPVAGKSTADTLPFALPSAEPAAPTISGSDGAGRKLLVPLVTLLVGLALGVGGLALIGKMQDKETAESKRKPTPAEQDILARPPAQTSPAPQQSVPASRMPPAATPPVPAPPPAMPKNSHQPLPPGHPGAPLPTREVRIQQQGGLIQLVSGEYGAWNESVRDLIAIANPGLRDLDNLPVGTVVMLPALSREALVVGDATGQHHVYFGAFDKSDQAQQNLEAIQRTWPNAQLVTASRHGVAIQRLFIGPFASRSDATAVAGSLWFKHLPTLN